MKKRKSNNYSCTGTGGAIYGLGFIGALVHYLSLATGFWSGLLGILKSIIWPVFLVYEAFSFLAI